jgi:hypothetical protein
MVAQRGHESISDGNAAVRWFFIAHSGICCPFGVLQTHYAPESRQSRRRIRYRLVSAQVTNNRCVFFAKPL